MWDDREKTLVLRSQSMNVYSTASKLSSGASMTYTPPSNCPDELFPDEVSRKRKFVGSDRVSNIKDDVFPRFLVDRSHNMGHILPRELSSQRSVAAVDSQRKYPLMFRDHTSQFATTTTAEPQCGNYHFQDTNSSLMSLQRKEENFQQSAVDCRKSCAFSPNEPSFSFQLPTGGISKLPDTRNFAYDISRYSDSSKLESFYKQNSDFIEKKPVTFRSNNDLNLGIIDSKMPSAQYVSCAMSSQNLPSESSHLKMANEKFNCSGAYYQDYTRSGLELQKSGHENGFGEDNHASFSPTNSGQPSASDDKEISELKYSPIGIRSFDYTASDILGSHRDASRSDMLQLPAESSGPEEACKNSGMPKHLACASTNLETKLLEKDDGLNHKNKCHLSGDRAPPESKINHHATEPVVLGDDPLLVNLNEESKSVVGKISPSTEKLWDGSLQLNTSTTVSICAFFKSGEKAQDINWSEHIEIKGKVRLQAFEKFIQELPRSRNRALMVISLCWKIGSSKASLMGMKEIAKGYRESGRVGFAQICPGIDLYVCPRSNTILTILAKYGYFKGMAAVEEGQDSLIGCIIWRRSHPPSNSAPQKPERKKFPLPEQLVNSPVTSTLETSSPSLKEFDTDSKPGAAFSREPDGVSSQCISDTGNNDLNSARQKNENKFIQSSTNLNDATSHNLNSIAMTTSTLHSSPDPLQQNTAQKPEMTSLQENVERNEMQTAEPRNPDNDSVSMQLVHPGPPTSSDIHSRKSQPSKNFHGSFLTSPDSEFIPSIPFTSMFKQVRPFGTQCINSSSRQDQGGSVSNSGIPIMHMTEMNKPEMGFEKTQPALHGPPHAPEVQQTIINFSRDAHQVPVSVISKSETPTMHITESKKAALGFEPAGQKHPQAPQSFCRTRQKSASNDDDDLPEFDFSSALGVPEAPELHKSNALSRFSEAAKFNKQLPDGVVKSAGALLPPMPKSSEVMQGSQVSAASGSLFSAPRGSTLPIKLEELHSENKPEYQASELLTKPYNLPRLQASAIPGSSFSDPHGNTVAAKIGDLRSWNNHEYHASEFLSKPSTIKDDNGSTSLRSRSDFPQRNRWDDDDDMPEWCPPDLDHIEPQPSTANRPPSPILKRPPILPQPTFSYQSRSQGLFSGYRPGLLGPRPGVGNAAASMSTTPAGFARPGMSSRLPNRDHSLRSGTRQHDIRSPSDGNWSWRRP